MSGTPTGQAPAAPSGATSGLPHDIRGLLPLMKTWVDYTLYLLVAALAVAVVVLAWRYWQRRPSKIAAVPVDPWDDLRERLNRLRPELPFAQKTAEEFYFQLSLLLREGIELRTQVRATDLTSGELKLPLRRKLPFAPAETDAVLAFLEQADLVKFAGAPSTVAEAEAARRAVGGWIAKLVPLSIDQEAPIAVS